MNSIYRGISLTGIFLNLLYILSCALNHGSVLQNPLFYASVFCLLVLIAILIFPQKIEFISLPCFAFSLCFLFTSPFNEKQISLLFYIAACAVLFSRGYFRKNRWIKVGAATLLYLAAFMYQLTFGLQSFLSSLLLLAGNCFFLFLIIFFYYLYLRNQGKSPIEKFLDLSQFPELTQRDKEWLLLIQKETKYSTIAAEYNVSLGTVKNRMGLIFDIIDVSDRIGFMATYGGYVLSV